MTPLLVLMAWILSAPAMAAPEETKYRGDVNKDGKVTISDVTALVSIIKGQDDVEPKFDHVAADLNKDGSIDQKDVRLLVKIILSPKSGIDIGEDDEIGVNPGEEVDPENALVKKR